MYDFAVKQIDFGKLITVKCELVVNYV